MLFAISQSFIKKMYYCGQKPGETDIASKVSNEVSHDLKGMWYLE